MKDEVAVLGSPSLIVIMVSVDITLNLNFFCVGKEGSNPAAPRGAQIRSKKSTVSYEY